MKNRWLVYGIPFLILAIALAGGFTLLWRFFVFIVVLLLLNYFWTRLGVRGFEGRVGKTSDHSQVGKFLEEEFTVSRLGRIPAPLVEVYEDTGLPGYQNVISLDFFTSGSYHWQARAYCRRRGRYRIGSLMVRVTDPLGLFSVYENIGNTRDIVVYPSTLELPYFQVLPLQEPGQNPRRWLAGELSTNASRVREYTSGDSLRHIHWQTTAHTGRLVVKEFDPDRPSYAYKNIWLVLDMNQASRRGEGDETTEEYGVTIAASLAKKYINSGKSVGLISSGEQPFLLLPETGDEHLQDVLGSLAVMKATGKIPIDEFLASEADRFESGSAVIIIMPSGDRPVAATLRQVINRGVIANAVLLDSPSFGGGVSAASAARHLVAGGFRVYVVRRGQDIAGALDSRVFSPGQALAGVR
jgi:uncharacterized protein (DUF58 family)